ncbi:Glucosyltransferase-like protein [Chamberlinius hualienensis]
METGLLWLGSILSLLIRWTVSLFPYSGKGKKPMFGDYEAQRHWMEITYHLPVVDWYNQTDKNDLQYWGLDYPPLTAYHSYISGYVANEINPDWVALKLSRGYESYHHKLFMRGSVIMADLIIYYTAIIYYFYKLNCKEKTKGCGAIIALLYPGLILIDHGHFQYNCISLGLFVWSITCFQLEKDVLGAVLFTLALNYKQMELYHAFPIFMYLLGKCVQQRSRLFGLNKLIQLGIAVVLTFGICWLPFLHKMNLDVILQVVKRIFPVDRGLYEDKVANVWCSLSVLVKLKLLFPKDILAMMSAVSTFLFILPSSIHLLKSPTVAHLKYALINSSLIFFLFSFQVHEKSILLAAIPVTLVLHAQPLPSLWFLIITVLSMFPLLLKDRLGIPFYATSIIYLVITYRSFLKNDVRRYLHEGSFLIRIMFVASMFISLLLCVLITTLNPPERFPDIFTLAIAIFCCGHFLLFAVYYHYLQFNSPSVTHQLSKKHK